MKDKSNICKTVKSQCSCYIQIIREFLIIPPKQMGSTENKLRLSEKL